MTDRSPDTAPRCLACGYNLFTIESRHCPECGAHIETHEDLEAARWLAEANAADRRALRQTRIARWLGNAATAVGAGLCLARVVLGGGDIACITITAVACLLPVSLIIYAGSHLMRGANDWSPVAIGAMWMILGVLLCFA